MFQMRLIDHLTQETVALHADVDNELVLRPINPRAYQRYLARTYGFVAPIERSISTTPDIERYVDLRRFNKEELLRRDLLALHYSNHQIDSLPQCSVPLFNTSAEALGWAYFIERSTHKFEVFLCRISAPEALGGRTVWYVVKQALCC